MLKHAYLLVCFFLVSSFGARAATEETSPVYTEAAEVLRSVRQTSYTHDAYVDEPQGIYDFDCSAFATYALARSDGGASQALEEQATGTRPLAQDFVALFDSLQSHGSTHYWEAVRYARHLRAGDLIAWLIPAGSDSKDTGHVMIVAGQPTRNPLRKDEWLVPVIDAAASGHGHADPRRKAGPNGVGHGIVGLIVNSSDIPTGFRWSGGESSQVHRTEIRFGRPR